MDHKTEITPLQALQKAINIAGGRPELARLIGQDSPNHIAVMVNRDKKASASYVLKIHQVTGVPLHDLRPDLYPAPTESANDAVNAPNLA